jgi:uncharacterized lipoprotein YddW (UPF0748 family)
VIAVLLVAAAAVVERLWARDVGSDSTSDHPAAVGEMGTCGGRPVSAQRQLRGMWLTTVNNIDWPSKPGLDEATVKAEYQGWLDLAQRLHHNAIFVHVRPSGDAFWPSQYAPWSEWLTGRRDGSDPGWDPMAYMIAEAHARNLEFHAWMNPYRGGQPATVGGPGGDINQLAPNHPLRVHAEWAVVYPVGTRASRLYFDPGIPDARRFVEDAMLEAVQKYDIDGVHFDDFFYPYPEAGQDFDDADTFATYGQGSTSKADWRRANVNALVREMKERIRAIKPWVKFGISPFGIWRNSTTDPLGSQTNGFQSYDQIYADTRLWVREGWVDYIVPQLYWNIGFDKADYAKLLPWWSDVVSGTKVQLYIGQPDYRVGESGAWLDPAELERHLDLNTRYPVAGNIHFSAASLRDDKLGAVTRYTAKYYVGPALVPAMAQLPASPPPAPSVDGIRREPDTGVTLTWRPGSADTAMYGVYRVEAGQDKAVLVGTARGHGADEQTWTDHSPSTKDGAQYCVSGLDRSWNEGRVSSPMRV